MEPDRQFIERRDFSTARRGYEPVEVQEHLRSVADAVDEMRTEIFRRQQEAGQTGLSSTAAEQVRVILDAAEQSAESIRQSAHDEAQALLDEAARQAEDAQARADAEARSHLERVQEATENLNQRADLLESELDGLVNRLREAAGTVIDTLRGEGGEVQGELDRLRRELEEARGSTHLGGGTAGAPRPRETTRSRSGDGAAADRGQAGAVEHEPAGAGAAGPGVERAQHVEQPEVAEPEPVTEPDVTAEPSLASSPGQDAGFGADVQEEESAVDEAPAPAPARGQRSRGGGSSEGARLIALNMALNGTPREETAEYLRREFDLEDDQMLDDVYARVRST